MHIKAATDCEKLSETYSCSCMCCKNYIEFLRLVVSDEKTARKVNL